MAHRAKGRAGLSCADESASGRHGEEDGPARWGRRVSGGALAGRAWGGAGLRVSGAREFGPARGWAKGERGAWAAAGGEERAGWTGPWGGSGPRVRRGRCGLRGWAERGPRGAWWADCAGFGFGLPFLFLLPILVSISNSNKSI